MRIWLIILFAYLALPMCSQEPISRKDSDVRNTKWELVWHDEFKNSKAFDKKWISENSAPAHILSSRWRSNISHRKRHVYLNNKKEHKSGKNWTTGSMSSNKTFSYGYYECRMKISASLGINNSFWLYCWNKTDKLHAFEIDIVEGHYPNIMNSTIHDRGTKISSQKKTITNKFISNKTLYDDFHVYGLWWTADFLNFYLDGNLIWSTPNTCCHQEATLVLGTAVLPWAGKISDSIDGTSMEVDYVRIWEEKNDK